MTEGTDTSAPFPMCTALYNVPYLFPDSPENGLVFYSLLLFCAMTIILYCLFRIRRQRRQWRKGEIRVMKQWLLPIYYSFLWCCIAVYAIRCVDIAIVYLFFRDSFQKNMPFVAALFHAASFWTSSFWLFNVILLFLASNSHGTQTIRRAFWVSSTIWMVSIVVITMGIEIPTNDGFLNFCVVYGVQCALVVTVIVFMCLRCYPHHQYIWVMAAVALLEYGLRFVADYLRYRHLDAFCLMDIADYLSSLVMPWLIIRALRMDSRHWSNLSVWMQTANRGSIYNTFSLHVMGHERQSMTAWSELLSQHTKLLKSEMLAPVLHDHEKRLIGGSGQVTRARYKGHTVAVKEWRFERFTKHVIALWCKEALISSNFRHGNIVQLIGICIEPPSIKIVMDWCRHGTLRKLLTSGKSLAWSERYSFLLDVANGMQHLHHNHLVHRDLKTLNLLIDEDAHGRRFVRICDFGSSRCVRGHRDSEADDEDAHTTHSSSGLKPVTNNERDLRYNYYYHDHLDYHRSQQVHNNDNDEDRFDELEATMDEDEKRFEMSTIVGSVQFLAPEILKNIQFKNNSRSAKSKGHSVYGLSADVYSFACVIWEVITRREIYKNRPYADIQTMVLSHQRPSIKPAEIQHIPDANFLLRLMEQCWNFDPKQRPSFAQILQIMEDRKSAFIRPVQI